MLGHHLNFLLANYLIQSEYRVPEFPPFCRAVNTNVSYRIKYRITLPTFTNFCYRTTDSREFDREGCRTITVPLCFPKYHDARSPTSDTINTVSYGVCRQLRTWYRVLYNKLYSTFSVILIYL